MAYSPEFIRRAKVAATRELCRRSLAEFVRRAWHVVEPVTPYAHGRHIDVICNRLEAISHGEINRLVINIPPGTAKSLIVSVFWPAWEWGPAGMPDLRIVAVSHEQKLAIRDNRRMRKIVESKWYQTHWPGVQLVADQNQKMNFENVATGFREAATAKSVTGRRGDRLILDDIMSVKQASSETERRAIATWFREAMPTRINDQISSAIVLVMQRLHAEDPTGIVIADKWPWEKLILPMRFDPARASPHDWRTEPGELLFPEKYPEKAVADLERSLGLYGAAGQLDQNPVPRAGGLFQRQWFPIVPSAPTCDRAVRYWDMAATADDGDYTVGTKIGYSQGDDRYYIMDVVRGRWQPYERDKIIKQTADLDGKKVKIGWEEEPGSASKSLSYSLKKLLEGFSTKPIRSSGDKVTRADPVASQAGIDRFRIVEGDWNKAWLEEVAVFPYGKNDDQVDSFSGAYDMIISGKKNVFFVG